MTAEDRQSSTPEEANVERKEIQALFVQTAKSVVFENGRLTLNGLAPTTLYFSDRPDRVVGHITSDEFLDAWDEGEDSFADDPPNAALSVFSHDGDEIHDIVVVLKAPGLKGDVMTYSVEVLDGEMLASGGPSSLFIDVIGRPLTPVSVAGARRRRRRRR